MERRWHAAGGVVQRLEEPVRYIGERRQHPVPAGVPRLEEGDALVAELIATTTLCGRQPPDVRRGAWWFRGNGPLAENQVAQPWTPRLLTIRERLEHCWNWLRLHLRSTVSATATTASPGTATTKSAGEVVASLAGATRWSTCASVDDFARVDRARRGAQRPDRDRSNAERFSDAACAIRACAISASIHRSTSTTSVSADRTLDRRAQQLPQFVDSLRDVDLAAAQQFRIAAL